MTAFNIVRGASLRPTTEKWLLNPFQSVAASSTAWLQLDIGPRYHGVMIPFGGTTMSVAHMSGIRLYLNSELVWGTVTGADIDALNQFEGFPAAATYGGLYLSFERMGLIDHIKRYDTCINTGVACKQAPHGINNFRIEIDIDAGAVAPTLGPACATISMPNPDQGLYLIRRTKTFENMQVTSPNEFLFATKYAGQQNAPWFSRLYIAETAANLSNLRLSINGEDKANISSSMNNLDIAQAGIRKVNTGIVVFDTAASGNFNGYYRIGQKNCVFDIRIKDSNVNAQLPVIVDRFGFVTS
jgi:hypothetical protein